jgi:AcrR family transcriptional regulator
MPYPSQVNAESILEKAIDMLEADGLDNLSLGKLAAALGVKAPSLYRYYKSKADLLRTINIVTTRQLNTAMRKGIAEAGDDPYEQIMGMARAYRHYATTYPVVYSLNYNNMQDDLRPDDDEIESLSHPLEKVMARIVGEENALTALRGAWAMLHGFAMLENSQQFRRGGSLDEAFETAIRTYIAGLGT